MAALRGTVQGYAKNGSTNRGEASRLGHGMLTTHAGTWRTFVDVEMHADGRTSVHVRRDDRVIHSYSIAEEN